LAAQQEPAFASEILYERVFVGGGRVIVVEQAGGEFKEVLEVFTGGEELARVGARARRPAGLTE
jgi:hypothetical protein